MAFGQRNRSRPVLLSSLFLLSLSRLFSTSSTPLIFFPFLLHFVQSIFIYTRFNFFAINFLKSFLSLPSACYRLFYIPSISSVRAVSSHPPSSPSSASPPSRLFFPFLPSPLFACAPRRPAVAFPSSLRCAESPIY